MNMLDEFTPEELIRLASNRGTNVNNIKRGDVLASRHGIFATVAVVEEETHSTPIKRHVSGFTVKTHTNELLWLTPQGIIDQGWQLMVAEDLYLPK